MLVSAPKTPENEENGAAIRSRRWCRRRPQSGICLHSLVEGSCQLTVPGHGRGHAKHSPMSATRILVMRSAGRFKMQKYIRHSFQVEGLGIGALAGFPQSKGRIKPERTTKSSTRCCFSMKRLCFPAHVAHRALPCALRLSLFSEPSLTCLGLEISRFSAASAIGASSHIRCLASELSGGRGHASRNP